MKTWIALLRGVNMVGKHKVPMKDLVALLVELGARDVKTYRGSGNAIFRHRARVPSRLAKQISVAISKTFGFEPLCLLLEVEQLGQAMDNNPFVDDIVHPGELVVGFLGVIPEHPDLTAIEAVKLDSEQFALRDDVFYFHAPEGFHKSKLGGVLEKALGVGKAGTGRTWSTLLKVRDLANSMA